MEESNLAAVVVLQSISFHVRPKWFEVVGHKASLVLSSDIPLIHQKSSRLTFVRMP
jgi:hypothetical protein